MIEEGAAKSAHEIIIGQRIALRDRPQRQLRAVVMAHNQSAGIAESDEFVVPAAVDLHLVFIKAMRQISGRRAEGGVEAGRIVDGERRVGQMGRPLFVDGRPEAIRRQAAPHRRQFGQRRAVAIELPRGIGGDARDTAGAGEMAVQIVEAAVLRVEHNDRLDFFETRRRR